jgi:mRNA-degrading endonuclease RelE of RelBE toxin-antitoxin system
MAKGVNTYQVSRRFKKEYNGLPKEIQKAFDQKLQVFLKDMAHPSLRVKRIQGTRDRWEGSVTMKYRFTFEFSEGILILRAIGTHDIIIKESQ